MYSEAIPLRVRRKVAQDLEAACPEDCAAHDIDVVVVERRGRNNSFNFVLHLGRLEREAPHLAACKRGENARGADVFRVGVESRDVDRCRPRRVGEEDAEEYCQHAGRASPHDAPCSPI